MPSLWSGLEAHSIIKKSFHFKEKMHDAGYFFQALLELSKSADENRVISTFLLL